MVGLERRGQKVRDRRSRRTYDDRGEAGLPPDAERREARDALVDPHVHPHEAARLELRSDERERLRP